MEIGFAFWFGLVVVVVVVAVVVVVVVWEMWEWPEVQVGEMHQWKSGSAVMTARVRRVSYLVHVSVSC